MSFHSDSRQYTSNFYSQTGSLFQKIEDIGKNRVKRLLGILVLKLT